MIPATVKLALAAILPRKLLRRKALYFIHVAKIRYCSSLNNKSTMRVASDRQVFPKIFRLSKNYTVYRRSCLLYQPYFELARARFCKPTVLVPRATPELADLAPSHECHMNRMGSNQAMFAAARDRQQLSAAQFRIREHLQHASHYGCLWRIGLLPGICPAVPILLRQPSPCRL